MKKSVFKSLFAAVVFVQGAVISGLTMAAVPSPPVIQKQGIPDGVFNNLAEPICRSCHNQNPPPNIPVNPLYLPERHHLRVNQPIQANTDRPNEDPDGDGVINTEYVCLSCHSQYYDPVTFSWKLVDTFRDCMTCHNQDAEATVHHMTTFAADQDCKACHGGLINNPGDGHYIPTYQPSMVTPWPSGKPNGGTETSSADTHPGNCNFCHNTADGLVGDPAKNLEETQLVDSVTGDPVIIPVYQNMETHHGTGLALVDSTRCTWCHDVAAGTGEKIRQCEACHGVSSLHNITSDSNGDGNVTPGAETPGYSHTGGQPDCWGCHGNNGSILSAPFGGPGIPSISSVDHSSVPAGTDSTVTLGGMNFTNYIQNPWTGNFDIYVTSVVRLIDGAGNETDYVPSNISEGSIEVVIPGSVAPGSYRMIAAKGPSTSNPVNLVVVPGVSIASAKCVGNGKVTVTGSGFSEYLDTSDSGTNVEMGGEAGSVTTWSDTSIKADFSGCGTSVTVNSVFGSASASVD